MNYSAESDGTVRVISFQSPQVLDKLLGTGYYRADNNLSRERRDYSKDVEQLGGFQPIWGFALPFEYTVRTIYRGGLFINFRSEMSMQGDRLTDFVCLELFIPKEFIKVGITHNSCYFAVVFPFLFKKYLHRIYKVKYKCDVDNKGCVTDLPSVETIKVFNTSKIPTFEDNFNTLSIKEYRANEGKLTTNFPFKQYPIGTRYNYEDINILEE